MNMNTATSHLNEMRKHRAFVAGEYLGDAILAVTRWVARIAQALRAPGTPVREQAHTPR
jgi:hypothetical protein